MPEKPSTERHNINLSRHVWGELKLRAFQENLSASELIEYIIEKLAGEVASLYRVSKYQQRNPEEDRLGRTVFLSPQAWQKALALAKEMQISVSALIEYLLRRYLGLNPAGDPWQETRPERKGTILRIGEDRVYLGENPVIIDLKTGKHKDQTE
jgi:hypothetical protein